MDKIQYSFTDPNSTMEMLVTIQDAGADKISDDQIAAAFIAAAAKIAEIHVANARFPMAAYHNMIDRFAAILRAEIFNDENSNAILKNIICGTNGGQKP